MRCLWCGFKWRNILCKFEKDPHIFHRRTTSKSYKPNRDIMTSTKLQKLLVWKMFTIYWCVNDIQLFVNVFSLEQPRSVEQLKIQSKVYSFKCYSLPFPNRKSLSLCMSRKCIFADAGYSLCFGCFEWPFIHLQISMFISHNFSLKVNSQKSIKLLSLI